MTSPASQARRGNNATTTGGMYQRHPDGDDDETAYPVLQEEQSEVNLTPILDVVFRILVSPVAYVEASVVTIDAGRRTGFDRLPIAEFE